MGRIVNLDLVEVVVPIPGQVEDKTKNDGASIDRPVEVNPLDESGLEGVTYSHVPESGQSDRYPGASEDESVH